MDYKIQNNYGGNKVGKADYQFVEIMACPGGCIMGGGQPIKNSKIRATVDVRKKES